MLVDGGGGGGRRVVVPAAAPVQRSATNGPEQSRSNPSDAGAELRRRLEALQRQMREAQRQAEAARKQALQAQQEAQAARRRAEEARTQADRTGQPKDQSAARQAEQQAKLEDAQFKKKSATADLRDKEVVLLEAEQDKVREQKRDPAGKASPAADQKVRTAQAACDEAKQTVKLSGRYADWQEAESLAVKAEAAEATSGPSPMMLPGGTPADLRHRADALGEKFRDAADGAAQRQLFGAAPEPAAAAQPFIGPTARSPLDQLLQVSPFPTQNSSKAGTPLSVTLAADLADGKSLEQIASGQCKSVDQVVAEAAQAGLRIEASEAGGGDVQITTLTQGGAHVTYSHDLQHGAVNVNGSFTDAQGKRQEMIASQDGNGVISRTVHDPDKDRTVTESIDTQAGTRTELVVHPNGRRTETTTDLTGAPVEREVKAGDSFAGIAREHGLDPKQLLALNPDLKSAKDFYAGRDLVVAGPRSTVKEFRADGSMLQTDTGTNGSRRMVFEADSGKRTTLQGTPDAQEQAQKKVRDGLFKDGKTVAQVADGLGMTQDEVLSSLDKGTVDLRPASSDNGDVEIRRLYDPASNTMVIETHDYQHDSVRREVIDDKDVFKVRRVDPETEKYVEASMSGGAGYAQLQANREQGQVDDLGRQIRELDGAIRTARKTGDPVPELLARRSELVAQQDAAKLDVDLQQGKATSVLLARQQYEMEHLATLAADVVSTAPRGSAAHTAAAAVLDEVIGQLDHLDRAIDFAAADVVLLQAKGDLHHAQAAQQQADRQLESQYQTWKRNVWTWNGMSEQEIKRHEEQGARPPGHAMYRNAQEEDEAARKDFDQYQRTMDATHGFASTGGEVPCRDAWLVRNQAGDAALKSKAAFNDASIAQQDAELTVTQGDIARLQEKKNIWMKAHPDAFSETFAQQADLDKAQTRVADLSVGGLLSGEERKHDLYLLSLPAEQRHYAPQRKEAEQHYQDDNKVAHAQLATQVDQIGQSVTNAKAAAADGFISRWNQDHPDLKAQLDTLDAPDGAPPFVRLRMSEERNRLLGSTPEFRNLKAALDVRAQVGAEMSKRASEGVERINQDLEQVEKGMESHSWVRDGWSAMFGDASEDAKDYTQDQLGQAKTLQDDLAAGKISQSEFADQQGVLMAGYGVESLSHADKLEDSDQTWGVVDEAVRATAIMAAGIGTTLLTGGNVMAGFAVATAVSAAWDTTGDIVAMAQGRDMHADGHSSLWGLGIKASQGDATWGDVRSTLKDELIDVATNAVSAGGLGAGLRTSAALTARLGGGAGLNLGQRAAVGAGSGFVSQGVDGAGRVGVETLRVGLDGKLGTAEGGARIRATLIQSGVGLATAPLTGAISGALPVRVRVPGAAISAQYVNDAAGNLGTTQLATLANEGRGMNRAEFIAASVQSVAGTMTNILFRPPSRVVGADAPPQLYQVGKFEGAKGDGLNGWPVTDANGETVAVIRSGPEAIRFMDAEGAEELPAPVVDLLQRAGPLMPIGVPIVQPDKQPRTSVELSADPAVHVELGTGGIAFKAGPEEDAPHLAAGEIAKWMDADPGHGADVMAKVLHSRAGMNLSKGRAAGIAVLELPAGVRTLMTPAILRRAGADGAKADAPPHTVVAIVSGERRSEGVVGRRLSPAGPAGTPTPLGSYIPGRARPPSGAGTGSVRAVDAEKVFFEAIGRALRTYAKQQGLPPAEIEGRISVYADRTVCDSCRSVSTQFQLEFPSLHVRVKSVTDEAGPPAHHDVAQAAALAAGDVYKKSMLNPQGSRGLVNWRRADDAQVLRLTGHDPAELERKGLGVRVYQPDPVLAGQGFKTMVVFRGSEVGRAALPNWRDNVLHGLGRQTEYDRIAADIGTRLQGQDVLLVGHSLGGRLAAVASRTSGLDAVTFNAAGVNKTVWHSLPDAQGRITAYRLSGDPLTLLQDHTPLASAPGELRTLRGPRRGALTLNHLMGPFIDSMRRGTPSGKRIDADLLHRTRLSRNDPRLRQLLRSLDRAGTQESKDAAKLIRSGELHVNVFKRDPLGGKRDGFYVDDAHYIGITVPHAWLARPRRVAGIVTHEAVHYRNRNEPDPHSVALEVQAMRAQGAVDPRHWSNRVPDDAALGEMLAREPARGGDSVSSRSNPLGRARTARATVAGVNLAALSTAAGVAAAPFTTAGLDALPFAGAGVVSLVAAGSLMRSAIKSMRFAHAGHWNKQHRLLTGRLDGKLRFEQLANELVQAGGKQPAAKGQDLTPGQLRRGFKDAAEVLAKTVPEENESRPAYQQRVVRSIDELARAGEALGMDSAVVRQKADELRSLAKQKASFDVALRSHVGFVEEKVEKFPNVAAPEDKIKFEKELAKVQKAEELLRKSNAGNDRKAKEKLAKAVEELNDVAKLLRPGSSALRKRVDLLYSLTYGAGLGAFAHKLMEGEIPGGTAGTVLIGMLAGANALDLVRIGGTRFDEWMRGRSGPAEAARGAVDDSWLFKKGLPGGDDALSALAGVGLAVMALKSGLSPGSEQDIVRVMGTSTYAAASGYQFAEGLRRFYRDPSDAQRPMYLNSRVLAGVGAAALVATSLIVGLIAEEPQDQPPAPPVAPPSGQPHGLPSGHPTTRLRDDPPPIERIVTADGDQVDTAGSLWAIARNNLDWILTPQQQALMEGPVATQHEATQRLSQFNGFDPRLMDGRITNAPGDPDLLLDGWKVNVNTLGLTRPPTS